MPSRDNEDKNVIRAHDLLYLYLEFQTTSPNRLDWNAPALSGNPTRLGRYQRLLAILAAFDIKTDFTVLENCDFISKNDQAHEPLLARAREELPESLVTSMERRGSDFRYQLRDLFRMLIEY